MRRWLGGLLAALLAAAPLMAVDKSADAKGEDRATQFKKVQEDYRKAVPDARKALGAAKTPEDRKAVFKKLNDDFVPRVLKFADADPKDKQSLEMLTWAIQALPDVDSKVFDSLAKHWAGDAKIKRICLGLAMDPHEGATKLLQKVLDDNADKDAKGLACFALAKAESAKVDKGDKNDKDNTKASERAEKLYERVEKEFADVKLGRDTLGEQTKNALFELRHLSIGKMAPNVESETLEGKKVQLKDYKGKVVVLDIWATWCGPCRAMIPHEREMVKKLKDKPFALISISADAEKDTLKNFIEKTPMPWTHWWNGQKGGILKDWNVRFFPTLYVIDAKGVIRYKHIRGAELEEAVEKLVAEAKK